MARKVQFGLLLAVILVCASLPLRSQEPWTFPHRPKLILVLIIDQFRYDYLMRYQPYFGRGGFNRLLEGGAVFTDCRYDYATTITGPGHATLMTGAYPVTHGIIGNDWYDRDRKREVYCVEDMSTRIVANRDKPSPTPGFSPRNLWGSTLGDELRLATDFRSKVVSLSLKDRAAVLMGGHTPSAAYWYDQGSGHFVTSTYYMPSLPAWVDEFNRQEPTKRFCGQPWQALPETPDAAGRILSDAMISPNCPNQKFLAWLADTPFMTEIELDLASAALRSEQLGKGPAADLMAISLSVNDYIGHRYAPHSAEVADTTLRTDHYLAKFFDDLDKQVGLENVWIAFSADHGAAPSPAFVEEHRLGPGMAQPASIRGAVEDALTKAFGPGPWIEDQDEVYLYLNRDTLQKRNTAEAKAEEFAARVAAAQPGVAAAFTRSQILAGNMPRSPLARKVTNSFNSERSGDVFLVLKPFAVPSQSATGTTHGSPWNYDAQVPLILWGSAFKPGLYHVACQPVDLAATLAAMLGLAQPSVAEGTPLAIALK